MIRTRENLFRNKSIRNENSRHKPIIIDDKIALKINLKLILSVIALSQPSLSTKRKKGIAAESLVPVLPVNFIRFMKMQIGEEKNEDQ